MYGCCLVSGAKSFFQRSLLLTHDNTIAMIQRYLRALEDAKDPEKVRANKDVEAAEKDLVRRDNLKRKAEESDAKKREEAERLSSLTPKERRAEMAQKKLKKQEEKARKEEADRQLYEKNLALVRPAEARGVSSATVNVSVPLFPAASSEESDETEEEMEVDE